MTVWRNPTEKVDTEYARLFTYYPVGPFHAEPYDAVRGVTWTIWDANEHCIATVWEEEAAMLIVQRLNAST